ncbi:MAG TPA: O-antigen polysaccharide polymerase Wzy [Acidimicrobiales bacterium]|nr:O-antigen polysaccharide polymerase Wzy [Acidimicrobiales bacterium]
MTATTGPTTRWGPAAPHRSLSLRGRILLLLLLNEVVLIALSRYTSRPVAGAFVAATAFWGLLAVFPSAVNSRVIFSVRNYMLFAFWGTMVLGPPVMLFESIYPRLYLLSSASWNWMVDIWPYMLPASLLWSLAFAAYVISQRPRPSSEAALPSRGRPPRRRDDSGERPAGWMLITGIVLILAGAAGILAVSGSLHALLSVAGKRSNTNAVFQSDSGTYRYTIWVEGVPVGAALVWYYVTQRRPMGRLASAIWLAVLYLPLVPFYLYNSGRESTLGPLVVLLALYHRYVVPFRARWLVIGLLLALPGLAAWKNYREAPANVSITQVSVTAANITATVAGDLSRYDVSVVSLAGFETNHMGYYLGTTLVAAATEWLPPPLSKAFPVNGTMAQAQTFVGNATWRGDASYATSMMTESFLNFGVLGVVVFFLLLGWLVRWLDRFCESGSILAYVLALEFALRIPFGITMSQGVSDVLAGVLLPLLVAVSVRALLGVRRQHRVDGTGSLAGAPTQGAAGV